MKRDNIIAFFYVFFIFCSILQIFKTNKLTVALCIFSVLVYFLYLAYCCYKDNNKLLSVLSVALGILIISYDLAVLCFSSIGRHQIAIIIRLAEYALMIIMNYFIENK